MSNPGWQEQIEAMPIDELIGAIRQVFDKSEYAATHWVTFNRANAEQMLLKEWWRLAYAEPAA